MATVICGRECLKLQWQSGKVVQHTVDHQISLVLFQLILFAAQDPSEIQRKTTIVIPTTHFNLDR